MEKLRYFREDLYFMLRIFSLHRLFFKNLWLLCLTIYAKWILVHSHKTVIHCINETKRNRNDPFYIEFTKYCYSRYNKPYKEIQPEEDTRSIKSKLNGLMKEKQLYRNMNLSIDDISRELATNRTYVSKEIKRSFQCGFRDYRNRFRLEKAIELIRAADYANLNLIAVSEQAGFKNYSTFNTQFKKEYGMTPRKWKLREDQLSRK